MTRTSYRSVFVACALVSLAGLVASCDLNPQPLPPNDRGSNFGTGSPPMVLADASTSGGDDGGGGGGFNLSGDAATAPRVDGGTDGAPTVAAGGDASSDATASVEGGLDGAGDSGALDGDAEPEDTWQPLEGGQ